MKHIGIVDITTVGACICANALVAKAAETMGNFHPEFTMHALPFAKYAEAISKEDWDMLAELILSSIQKLKLAGADFIIMPSNTPHYAFDKVKLSSPLPLLNLIEITVDECKKLGYQKVLILGTKPTMQGSLYAAPLQGNGLVPVVPSVEDQEAIHRFIFEEIIPSKVKSETTDAIAGRINQYTCDAAILGCTELPEVFNDKNIRVPTIDTTRLLAYKALEYSKLG